MHQIKTTGCCGLVIDLDRRKGKSKTTHHRLASSTENAEFTGHFILNRYRVDDDGHVCLSLSLPLSDLRGSIEVLTAELESLLEQAEQRFPEAKRAP